VGRDAGLFLQNRRTFFIINELESDQADCLSANYIVKWLFYINWAFIVVFATSGTASLIAASYLFAVLLIADEPGEQTFLRNWPDLDVFRQRRNSELDQLLSSEIGKCLWPLFFPVH